MGGSREPATFRMPGSVRAGRGSPWGYSVLPAEARVLPFGSRVIRTGHIQSRGFSSVFIQDFPGGRQGSTCLTNGR